MTEFVDRSRLEEKPEYVPNARDMLHGLLHDHEATVRNLREDIAFRKYHRPDSESHGKYYARICRESGTIVGWYKTTGFQQTGPTPLVAAARCFVASRLGDEVEAAGAHEQKSLFPLHAQVRCRLVPLAARRQCPRRATTPRLRQPRGPRPGRPAS